MKNLLIITITILSFLFIENNAYAKYVKKNNKARIFKSNKLTKNNSKSVRNVSGRKSNKKIKNLRGRSLKICDRKKKKKALVGVKIRSGDIVHGFAGLYRNITSDNKFGSLRSKKNIKGQYLKRIRFKNRYVSKIRYKKGTYFGKKVISKLELTFKNYVKEKDNIVKVFGTGKNVTGETSWIKHTLTEDEVFNNLCRIYSPRPTNEGVDSIYPDMDPDYDCNIFHFDDCKNYMRRLTVSKIKIEGLNISPPERVSENSGNENKWWNISSTTVFTHANIVSPALRNSQSNSPIKFTRTDTSIWRDPNRIELLVLEEVILNIYKKGVGGHIYDTERVTNPNFVTLERVSAPVYVDDINGERYYQFNINDNGEVETGIYINARQYDLYLVENNRLDFKYKLTLYSEHTNEIYFSGDFPNKTIEIDKDVIPVGVKKVIAVLEVCVEGMSCRTEKFTCKIYDNDGTPLPENEWWNVSWRHGFDHAKIISPAVRESDLNSPITFTRTDVKKYGLLVNIERSFSIFKINDDGQIYDTGRSISPNAIDAVNYVTMEKISTYVDYINGKRYYKLKINVDGNIESDVYVSARTYDLYLIENTRLDFKYKLTLYSEDTGEKYFSGDFPNRTIEIDDDVIPHDVITVKAILEVCVDDMSCYSESFKCYIDDESMIAPLL